MDGLHDLESVARALVAPGKGILAADESLPTIGKRFEPLGIANQEEQRRAYREMLFDIPELAKYISGVILFDETIRQKSARGIPFPELLAAHGILPGIKVDLGAKPLAFCPGEKVTEGLDGLRERLDAYRALGARFCKWRAVIKIGDAIPTLNCLRTNAHALARYAALCQDTKLVPIVEPEVLMDGAHTIERSREVNELTWSIVFRELFDQGVSPEGMLLKPSMITSGKETKPQASVDEVAGATIASLRRVVPPAVPGIVFLSGGQSEVLATQHLNAMNRIGNLPWQVSFSYGRALQDSALKSWRGDSSKVDEARKVFLHRAHANSLARSGQYEKSMN
jgi:fructose-bisphosphate aldolase class I